MPPYDQPGDQPGQPAQGGQPPGQQQAPPAGPAGSGGAGAGQGAQALSDLSVSTPTLTWVTLGHPQESVPVGQDDHVLDSAYNAQTDTWEVLVLVRPGESESAADDERENEDE